MPLYRALKRLTIHNELVEQGRVIPLSLSPDKLRALEQVGAVAPVSTPPLAALPDWKTRAKKLPPGLTIEGFILSDPPALASSLGVTEDQIKTDQATLLEFLCTPPPTQK